MNRRAFIDRIPAQLVGALAGLAVLVELLLELW